MSSIKGKIYDMAGAIRYIKFSGDDEKFDERKWKTKAVAIHKGILKYLTKGWEITNEKMQNIIQINWRFMKETARLGIS